MDSDDSGESSSKKSQTKDKMSDGERPLKKARYAWQVKGRYHLKDQENNSDEVIQESCSSEASSSPEDKTYNVCTMDSPNIDITSKAEENLEILGDYLFKQDFSSLNPLLLDADSDISDKMSESDAINVETSLAVCSDTTLFYPKYIASHEKVPINSSIDVQSNLDLSESLSGDVAMSPVTLVPPRPPKTADQHLARWQARQLAKGFVDNTINRVLDLWLVAALPQTFENNHNLALEIGDFLDNLPSDNRVENEGILMAISAHGLQNNDRSIHQNTDMRNNRNFETLQSRRFGLLRNRRLSDTAIMNQYLQHPHLVNNTDVDMPSNSFPSSQNDSEPDKSSSDDAQSNDLNESNANQLLKWNQLMRPCTCPNSHQTPANIESTSNLNSDNSELKSVSVEENSDSVVDSADVDSNSSMKMEKEEENLQDVVSENGNIDDDAVQRSSNLEVDFSAPDQNDAQFGEHFDFMNAAVSFAIQNKGLTSFSSIDYG